MVGTDFCRVAGTGFHSDLLEQVARSLCGGSLPQHSVFQLETTFDETSMFRHLEYLGIGSNALAAVHIDEHPEGIRWIANLVPLKSILGVEMAHHEDRTPLGGATPTLTVGITLESVRSLEVEPLHCEDPECVADHGYGGVSKNEGIFMTFTDDAAAGSTTSEAMVFVGELSKKLNPS